MEIADWRLAHSGQGGNEALQEEPTEETRLEEIFIHEQELQVDEALQPQSSVNTEFIPSGSSSGESNSLPDCYS